MRGPRNKIIYSPAKQQAGIVIQSKHGKHVAIIDTADLAKVLPFKWCLHKDSNNTYAYGFAILRGKRKRVSLHRLIAGEPKGKEVDHRDGNGLNNTRANLRECFHVDNTKNRKASIKPKGVAYRPYGYEAIITNNNKRYYLGSFKTKQLAVLAYNKAALELHGEFARLNPVTP